MTGSLTGAHTWYGARTWTDRSSGSGCSTSGSGSSSASGSSSNTSTSGSRSTNDSNKIKIRNSSNSTFSKASGALGVVELSTMASPRRSGDKRNRERERRKGRHEGVYINI